MRESKAILKKANQRLARYLMTHQRICILAQQLAVKQPQNTNRTFSNFWSRVLKSMSIEQQLKKIKLVEFATRHLQKNQTEIVSFKVSTTMITLTIMTLMMFWLSRMKIFQAWLSTICPTQCPHHHPPPYQCHQLPSLPYCHLTRCPHHLSHQPPLLPYRGLPTTCHPFCATHRYAV